MDIIKQILIRNLFCNFIIIRILYNENKHKIRNWIVRISHVYREANRLADGLTNYAFSLPLGLHFLETIPPSVVTIVEDDIRGTVFPRHVQI